MGRPKISSDMKRRFLLGAKFTAPERARVFADAERLGVDVSELIRQRTLTGRVQVRQTTELAAADRIQLQRVGINLNQIARHLNEQGGSLPAIAALDGALHQTLGYINDLLLRAGDGS